MSVDLQFELRSLRMDLQVYSFEFCEVYEWTSVGLRFDLPMVIWSEYQPSVTTKVRREGGEKMTGEKNRSHLGVVLCKKAPVLVPATTTIIFTTYNHNHHFYNIQPQLSFLQHTTTTTIFTTYNHNHHFYNIQLQPQPSFSQPTITTIILATFRFVA